jgi:hypothetical protein
MSADLYSNSGVQRNLEGLCSSKVKVNFSATGRGLQLAEKAAKYAKTGASLVTSLTIMTCWRGGSHSNSLYRSLSGKKLHVSAHFAAYVKTSIRSIYFGLLSASRTWRRALTGSKAPGDSWISSSPVHGQSNRLRDLTLELSVVRRRSTAIVRLQPVAVAKPCLD